MATNYDIPFGTDLGIDLGTGYPQYSDFPDYSSIFSGTTPGPASSEGGGFLGGLGNFIGKNILPNLGSATRIAGAVGDIVRGDELMDQLKEIVGESTEKLDTRAVETLGQIRDIFDEIRGLTGVATQDAVQDYYKRFDDYMTVAMDQARADLATQPDLTRQYDTLKTRIGDVRSSDLNLLNSQQFMDIAKRPQDYMSKTDVNAIKDVMTLGPEYRQHYSYSDPKTQGLIGGRPSAVQEYASFFANSPEVRGMMEYKV